MRVLIFLLIPFFLFGKNHFMIFSKKGYYEGIYEKPVSLGPLKSCSSSVAFICNGIGYKTFPGMPPSYNIACIYRNSHKYPGTLCSGDDSFGAYVYVFQGDFCLNKKGYFYNKNNNVWYPTSDSNSKPICPEEKIYNPSSASCVNKPKCPKNIPCSGPGKILDPKTCVCKCEGPLVYNSGECVPNSDLNKSDCEAQGGIYLDSVSVGDLFSDPKYAYLVMQVPLFSSHLCYTKDWLTNSLNNIKNALSPKKVLTAALGFLPIGKIKYVFRADEIADEISKTAKNPKVLQDKQPVIDTKYNPETGTYEPLVNLKPRDNPLPANVLLQAPKDTADAQDLISTAPGLSDLLNSPFVTKGDISTEADLTDAVTEFNMDHNLRAGTQTKIADDLREIFNRSKPEEKTNFPITIKDNVGEDEEIPAQVQRSVAPVPNTPNAYNVEYIITPQGASKPVTINYYVIKAATSSAPAGAASAAPEIVATPTYQLGQTKYVGKEIVIKKSPSKTNSAPDTKADAAKKAAAQTKVNYNSFVTPTQNAITTAFNYKISLFTCPNVSPKCPNSLEINWNNMGIKGKYKIPDPMCAVITAIDNPKISPVIATAGNLIILVAGILGALSLFRRD